MSPQKSNVSQSFPNNTTSLSEEQNKKDVGSCNEDVEETSWGFTRVLANTNTNTTTRNGEHASEEVYVHPLAKSSLSSQSLEMCTEGLGSETGSSNGGEFMDDLSSSCLSFEKQDSSSSPRKNQRKLERNATFPPPLTLIGGSDGIQLRPHREEGRLVLKAVTFTRKSCFQAERTCGRLRLKLFPLSKNVEIQKQSEQVEVEEDEGSIEEGEDFDGLESNYYSEEELECEEIPRPSRCKEEGPAKRGLQISWDLGAFLDGYFLGLGENCLNYSSSTEINYFYYYDPLVLSYKLGRVHSPT